MKKKLRVIIITLVLLLAGTGAFLWKMNDMNKKMEQKEQAKLKEERDLLEDQKDKAINKVDAVNIIPLEMSGDKKNVVTIDYPSVEDIYDTNRSARAEKNLTDIKKNKIFSLKDALWAYNPYGTNHSSMYVYFETSGKCYCKYTISVDDANIPDFTRTARTGKAGNVSTEHEYQILGLVPGMKNYITLAMYNSDDELSEKQTFSIDIPASPSGASAALTAQKGRSKATITNGLYVLFQDEKAKSKAILMYDNSGILRSEIPLCDNIAKNFTHIYDTMTYAVSSSKIVQMNALGQVIKAVDLTGYKQSGEFAYDGYGNLYVIATPLQKNASPKSKILEVELESGKVSEVLDMNTLLKQVYKKTAGKKGADWIDLNSIQVVGTNKLLLSSKKLSSIFKVSNVGSILPKINYIIADKKLYKSYKGLQKKVLTKSDGTSSASSQPTATESTQRKNILHKEVKKDPFVSQYGQEAIQTGRKTSGTYALMMLNNNVGTRSTNDHKSYYYRYQIDESSRTYQLKAKQEFGNTQKNGNAIKTSQGYLYCCSDQDYFVETDNTGKMIKAFHPGYKTDRVVKNDFMDFWFY